MNADELPLFEFGNDRDEPDETVDFFAGHRPPPDQAGLDFDAVPDSEAPDDPFADLNRRIRREWCLPIGFRVRVVLRDIDDDETGVLRVATFPQDIDRRRSLHLRIGRREFHSDEIEQCARLD